MSKSQQFVAEYISSLADASVASYEGLKEYARSQNKRINRHHKAAFDKITGNNDVVEEKSSSKSPRKPIAPLSDDESSIIQKYLPDFTGRKYTVKKKFISWLKEMHIADTTRTSAELQRIFQESYNRKPRKDTTKLFKEIRITSYDELLSAKNSLKNSTPGVIEHPQEEKSSQEVDASNQSEVGSVASQQDESEARSSVGVVDAQQAIESVLGRLNNLSLDHDPLEDMPSDDEDDSILEIPQWTKQETLQRIEQLKKWGMDELKENYQYYHNSDASDNAMEAFEPQVSENGDNDNTSMRWYDEEEDKEVAPWWKDDELATLKDKYKDIYAEMDAAQEERQNNKGVRSKNTLQAGMMTQFRYINDSDDEEDESSGDSYHYNPPTPQDCQEMKSKDDVCCIYCHEDTVYFSNQYQVYKCMHCGEVQGGLQGGSGKGKFRIRSEHAEMLAAMGIDISPEEEDIDEDNLEDMLVEELQEMQEEDGRNFADMRGVYINEDEDQAVIDEMELEAMLEEEQNIFEQQEEERRIAALEEGHVIMRPIERVIVNEVKEEDVAPVPTMSLNQVQYGNKRSYVTGIKPAAGQVIGFSDSDSESDFGLEDIREEFYKTQQELRHRKLMMDISENIKKKRAIAEVDEYKDELEEKMTIDAEMDRLVDEFWKERMPERHIFDVPMHIPSTYMLPPLMVVNLDEAKHIDAPSSYYVEGQQNEAFRRAGRPEMASVDVHAALRKGINFDTIDNLIMAYNNKNFHATTSIRRRQERLIRSFIKNLIEYAYPGENVALPGKLTLKEAVPIIDEMLANPSIDSIITVEMERDWENLKTLLSSKRTVSLKMKGRGRVAKRHGGYSNVIDVERVIRRLLTEEEIAHVKENLVDYAMQQSSKEVNELYPEIDWQGRPVVVLNIVPETRGRIAMLKLNTGIVGVNDKYAPKTDEQYTEEAVRRMQQDQKEEEKAEVLVPDRIVINQHGDLAYDGAEVAVNDNVPLLNEDMEQSGECVYQYLASRINHYIENIRRNQKVVGNVKNRQMTVASIRNDFHNMFNTGQDQKPGVSAYEVVEWCKAQKFITCRVFDAAGIEVIRYFAKGDGRSRGDNVCKVMFKIQNKHLIPLNISNDNTSDKHIIKGLRSNVVYSTNFSVIQEDDLQDWIDCKYEDRTCVVESEHLNTLFTDIVRKYKVIPTQFRMMSNHLVMQLVHPVTGEVIVCNEDYSILTALKNKEAGIIEIGGTEDKPYMPELETPDISHLMCAKLLVKKYIGELPKVKTYGMAQEISGMYNGRALVQIRTGVTKEVDREWNMIGLTFDNKYYDNSDLKQIDLTNCYPNALRKNRSIIPIFSDLDNFVLCSPKEDILDHIQYFIKGIWVYGFWFDPRAVMGANLKELIKLVPELRERVWAKRTPRKYLDPNTFTAFIDYVLANYPKAAKGMLNQFIGHTNQRSYKKTKSFIMQSDEELEAMIDRYNRMIQCPDGFLYETNEDQVYDDMLLKIQTDGTLTDDQGNVLPFEPKSTKATGELSYTISTLDIGTGKNAACMSIHITKQMAENMSYVYSQVMDNVVTDTMANLVTLTEKGNIVFGIKTDSYLIKAAEDFVMPLTFHEEDEIALPKFPHKYANKPYRMPFPQKWMYEEEDKEENLNFTAGLFYDGGAGSGKTTTCFKRFVKLFKDNRIPHLKNVYVTSHQNVTTQKNKIKFLNELQLGEVPYTEGDCGEIYVGPICIEFDTVCHYLANDDTYDLIIVDEVSMLSAGQVAAMYDKWVQNNTTCVHYMLGDFKQLPAVINQKKEALYNTSLSDPFRQLCCYRRIEKTYIPGKNRFDDKMLEAMIYMREHGELPAWAYQHINPINPELKVNLTYYNQTRKNLITYHGLENKDLQVGDSIQVMVDTDKVKVDTNLMSARAYRRVGADEAKHMTLKQFGVYVGAKYFIVENNVEKKTVRVRSEITGKIIECKLKYNQIASDVAITTHKSQGQTISEPGNIFEFKHMSKQQQYTALSRFRKLEYIHMVPSDKPGYEIKFDKITPYIMDMQKPAPITINDTYFNVDTGELKEDLDKKLAKKKRGQRYWIRSENDEDTMFYVLYDSNFGLNKIERFIWSMDEQEAIPRYKKEADKLYFQYNIIRATDAEVRRHMNENVKLSNNHQYLTWNSGIVNYNLDTMTVDKNHITKTIRLKVTGSIGETRIKLRKMIKEYLELVSSHQVSKAKRGAMTPYVRRMDLKTVLVDKKDKNMYHDLIQPNYDPEDESLNRMCLTGIYQSYAGNPTMESEQAAIEIMPDTYWKQARPLQMEAQSGIYHDIRTYKSLYNKFRNGQKGKDVHMYYNSYIEEIIKKILYVRRMENVTCDFDEVQECKAFPDNTVQELCTTNTRMVFDLDMPPDNLVNKSRIIEDFCKSLNAYMSEVGNQGLDLTQVRICKSENQARKISYHVTIMNHVFPSIKHQFAFTEGYKEFVIKHQDDYRNLHIFDPKTGLSTGTCIDNICTKNRAVRLPYCCKPGKKNYLIPQILNEDTFELTPLDISQYDPVVVTPICNEIIRQIKEYFVCVDYTDVIAFSEFSMLSENARKNGGKGGFVKKDNLKPQDIKMIKNIINTYCLTKREMVCKLPGFIAKDGKIYGEKVLTKEGSLVKINIFRQVENTHCPACNRNHTRKNGCLFKRNEMWYFQCYESKGKPVLLTPQH